MAHAHIVSDSDNHFVIDPISRQLNNNSKKTILMKTDHNSEQFTFELPRMVEGHDMSLSNKVEVHYINISSKTREQSTGIYNVADFGVDAEDDTKVLGTWLVSREATKYAGSLNFVIRFACLSADNVEEYAWNTAIYAGITIADTIENTETVVEDYVDILRQWLEQDRFIQTVQKFRSEMIPKIIHNRCFRFRFDTAVRINAIQQIISADI